MQKKHITQLKKDQQGFEELSIYAEHYDREIDNQKYTNVIIINAQQAKDAQILNALYLLLKDDFKSKKNIQALMKLAVYCGTFGISEVIGDSIPEQITNYVGDFKTTVADKFNEWLADYVTEKPIEIVSEKFEDKLDSYGEASNRTRQLGSELFLSDTAHEQILDLANNLSENHTPHEALQFTLKFIQTLSIDAPKLVVINSPFNLDKSSLSLCSLLFSHAKEPNQSNSSVNVSFLFNYSEEQPYDYIQEHSEKKERYKQLLRLRQFVQRYGMLEKPSLNIPNSAVNPSIFVGRCLELEQLKHQHIKFNKQCQMNDDSTYLSLWTLIKGEPGTGKTSLVYQYLNSIKSDNETLEDCRIRLKVLNQVGHSSQQTGLAALTHSVQLEAQRLIVIYKGKHNNLFKKFYKDKIVSLKTTSNEFEDTWKTKKLSAKRVNNALKFIASLYGLETIYEATESVFDSVAIEKHYSQTVQAVVADDAINKKEEQFRKLINAIKQLGIISDEIEKDANKQPLMLFIDDLQWIDELTCEFILSQLLEEFSVEVIVTARRSDSEVSYKLATDLAKREPFKIQLYDLVNLSGPNNNSNDTNINNETNEGISNQRMKILAPSININGMDKETLKLLLREVYENSVSEHLDLISGALINSIVEGDINEKTQVVTLFAIEAINVISDDLFYSRNPEVPRLITQTENNGYKINQSLQLPLYEAIKQIFEALKITHSLSYQHDSMKNEYSNTFSLSTYAVMEERLFIIGQYFNEYSDAAIFTLQLSALIGAPFDGMLIKSIILELSQVNLDRHDELESLKLFFANQATCIIENEHYDVLENIFSIINRYQLSSMRFSHRHSLIYSFLNEQIKYVLSKKLNLSIKGKEQFFIVVIQAIQKYFYDSNGKYKSINLKEMTMVFKCLLHNAMDVAEMQYLGAHYSNYAMVYALTLFREGHVEVASIEYKSVYKILDQLIIKVEKTNEGFSVLERDHAICCYHLGSLSLEEGKFEEAQRYCSIAEQKLSLFADKQPIDFTFEYAECLNLSSAIKLRDAQFGAAKKLANKAINALQSESLFQLQNAFELDQLVNEQDLICILCPDLKPKLSRLKQYSNYFRREVLYLVEEENTQEKNDERFHEGIGIIKALPWPTSTSRAWIFNYIWANSTLASVLANEGEIRPALTRLNNNLVILEILLEKNSIWLEVLSFNMVLKARLLLLGQEIQKSIGVLNKIKERLVKCDLRLSPIIGCYLDAMKTISHVTTNKKDSQEILNECLKKINLEVTDVKIKENLVRKLQLPFDAQYFITNPSQCLYFRYRSFIT